MTEQHRWTPKRQGNLGEVSAIEWLTRAGASLSKPIFEHPDYDLIADWPDGRLERVQVKTCTRRLNGRWSVMVCTRGGNQSWNGTVKRLHKSRCDALFVHVGDGRRWYLPIGAVDAGSALALGGPKYAAYEVESGLPLPSRQISTAA